MMKWVFYIFIGFFYDDTVGLHLGNKVSVHFQNYEEWIFISLNRGSKFLFFSLFFSLIIHNFLKEKC